MKFSYSNINMIAVSKIWEIMHNDSEGKKTFYFWKSNALCH